MQQPSTTINTRKESGRRKLRFESVTDLEEEVERLATADVECLGNWSLGQIFSHLARVMLIAVGENPIRPPFISRLIGFFLRPVLKKWLLETGMPAGIPHKGIPVIGRAKEAASQVPWSIRFTCGWHGVANFVSGPSPDGSAPMPS